MSDEPKRRPWAWVPRHDVLFLVGASTVAFLLPCFMRPLGITYLILYFTFPVAWPLWALLFSPRLSLWVHLIPLQICIAGTVLAWRVVYGGAQGVSWSLFHSVVFVLLPIGMFIALYVFFRMTLRTRKK
jgi:hypothetical protein